MYTIIEDRSPYFVRFKFTNLDQIINYIRMIPPSAYHVTNIYRGYSHVDLAEEQAVKILNELPLSQKFLFLKNRVSLFETYPGGGGGIHKDGTARKVSFNIPIEINDNKCITRWYDDSLFVDSEIIDFPNSRNVFPDHTKMQTIPCVESVNFRPDEMVLFNTDIYHSFDNTESDQWRLVLTLRLVDESISFEQAKQILLNG